MPLFSEASDDDMDISPDASPKPVETVTQSISTQPTSDQATSLVTGKPEPSNMWGQGMLYLYEYTAVTTIT